MKSVYSILDYTRNPYHDLIFRLLLSIGVAHFIVAHGAKEGFLGVIMVPGYGLSVLGSAVISFLLIQLVNSVSRLLYKRYSWEANWSYRLFLQLWFGVAMVIWIEYLCVRIFFFMMHYDFEKSRFMYTDFMLVVIFILLLNIYYFLVELFYIFQARHAEVQERLNRLALQNRKQIVRESPPRLQDINLEALGIEKDYLLYAFIKDGCTTIKYLDGRLFLGSETAEMLLAQLPDDEYFLINRNCIMSRLLIFSYKKASSRRYELILRHPFTGLKEQHENYVTVSQDSAAAFKSWYLL